MESTKGKGFFGSRQFLTKIKFKNSTEDWVFTNVCCLGKQLPNACIQLEDLQREICKMVNPKNSD